VHRRIYLLKVKDIETKQELRQPGWHADGGGLFLRVSDKGHRSWVFRFTVPGTTKREEVGAVLLPM